MFRTLIITICASIILIVSVPAAMSTDVSFVGASHDDASRSAEEIARQLRSVDQREHVVKALEAASNSEIVRNDALLNSSFLLLEAFHSIEFGTTNRSPRLVLREIEAKTRVSPWQNYMLEFAKGRLAVQEKDSKVAVEKVDWLIANYEFIEKERQRNSLCDAFIEGLSGPKGPFLAGLFVSKGVMLEKQGKLLEAKSAYEKVIRMYPETGWAVSARHGILAIDGAQK